MSNPLTEIAKFGQSIWYDNIRRGLITSGALARMVEDDGLVGVTSNPAIFTAAIVGSADYDPALKALVAQKVGTAVEIYEKLAIQDIQLAADVLYPVYLRTNRVDGYVSFEVSPYLANDTQGTIAEAKRLHAALGRENVLIKVPATAAGIPAIQALIGEGISVNVTLLFSVEAYEQVADAYLSGLEQYHSRGGDVSRVASVASFFISRIDTLIDEQIAGPGKMLDSTTDPTRRAQLKSLIGKVAIANAKLAYARYKELYHSQRWNALVAAKAMPQRLLWASTSTKNPRYPKTLYVEELIGAETVNTVPADTFDAFRKEGKVRPSLTENWAENIEQARETMATLAEVGIAMEDVTKALLADAVKKFSDPFDKLLASVETKRQALQGGLDSQRWSLGEFAEPVAKELEDWRAGGNVRRLWAGDASLWSGADEGNWLGWLYLLHGHRDHGDPFGQLVDDIRAAGFKYVLVLGMGGSSLAPEVWKKTFGSIPGSPELHVLDSTVPAQVRAFEKKVRLPETLCIVSSKSGGTIEPNVFKQYFLERMAKAVGPDQAGSHFIAITDPKTKMHEVAKRDRFRHIVYGLKSVGGRFSALSNFGLVPLAAMGVDTSKFLDSTDIMVQSCDACVLPELNPGVALGVILGTLAKHGHDKVTVIASPGIGSLGAWLEQLIAESTGKTGKGLVPVDGERVGPPDIYGPDRLFVYERLTAAPSAEQDEAVARLEKAGHPVVRIQVASTIDLGQEMFRWEIATAVAGAVMKINAFNQPDVEDAKVAARSLMTAYVEKGGLPVETPLMSESNLSLYADPRNAATLSEAAGGTRTAEAYLKAHLGRLHPGDYFAIQAYVEMNDAHDKELQSLRHAVRDAKRVATTLGYGPRFLHSTGQLHKGGPNSGVFLQITCDDAEDLPIPGEQFSFGVLKQAQAQGDFQVLAERGRRILRIHLGADVRAGLASLRQRVERALNG